MANKYVDPINNGSGMYFDRLGNVKISKEPLFIATVVNLSSINALLSSTAQELKYAKISSFQIQLVDEKSSFSKTIKSLEMQLNSCESQFRSLYNKRSKRFIGAILATISARKAKKQINKLSDALEELKRNVNENSILTENKFLAIRSDMKDMSFDITKLKENEIKLQNDLKDVRKTMEEEKKLSEEARKTLIEHGKRLDDVDAKIEDIDVVLTAYGLFLKNHDDILNLHSSLINKTDVRLQMATQLDDIDKVLNIISDRLRDVLNSINLAKLNVLDTVVVSHDSIFKELTKYVDDLPYNSELPYQPISSNVQKMMDISKVSCFVFEDLIMYVLEVPLVTKTEFLAYDYFPMPVAQDLQHPDLFLFIQPDSKHSCLALSRDKLSYTYIDSFKSCKLLEADKYFCETDRILSTGIIPTCETRLLTEPVKTVPEECQVRIVKGFIDVWHKLKNKQWLFVQTKINRLTIECDKAEPEEVEIIGSGVLTVPEECSAHTLSNQLIANEESGTIYPPPKVYLNIWNSGCCSFNSVNKTIQDKKPISLVASNLKFSIEESHEMLNEDNSLTIIYVSALVGIVLLLIVIFASYKLFGYVKGKQQSSEDPEMHGKRFFSSGPSKNSSSLKRFKEIFSKNDASQNQEETNDSKKFEEIEESEGRKKTTKTEVQNRKIVLSKNITQQSASKCGFEKKINFDNSFPGLNDQTDFKSLCEGLSADSNSKLMIKFKNDDVSLDDFFKK